MPFALDSNPEVSEISEAVNYLLANFSPNLSADPNTGQITGPAGEIAGYLYKYMAVKYADSFDGSLNFSNVPANRLYFGIRNNNDAAESSNPADYIWYKATGGFGSTKYLWYLCTGGRQIQFAVATAAPDTGWLVDPGSSIDLDVVTSGNIPVIAQSFVSYFTPTTLQVPRTGSPLTPVFTNITPVMFATNAGVVVPFTDAQTDSNVAFVNNSWRIGNSSTTGNGDISYTNVTVGPPTDAGDYAQWPNPTAMAGSPAYITVPVRYKNSTGVVSQAGVATVQLLFTDPGAQGNAGPTVDINGYTAFVQNAGGAFTPTTATLSANIANVTSPTYSWAISGATPTSATTASVVITPLSSSVGVTVTLTVTGSNITGSLTKTITMPVVYDGAPGQAGSNGLMSAFPTIYQWTGSSTPPTRPTTTSTYTWAGGSFTAPSGWSTSAPSNTVAGNYLWSITIPLNTSATTTTSTLDWTNTSYPIRAIAYNGANGANGTNGTNGTDGSNGAATYVITRTANDSSPPTNAEVSALLGRNPVAGDICTVSYNNFNNAVVYRYVTSWVLFQTYITGSLIVQNTITADKMVTGLMSADNTLTRGLTVRDNSGNILLAAGTPLSYTNITASSGWLNSNITINSNGTLNGAGGGSVSLGGLGAGAFATLNQITSANVTTYIAGAAIGTAQVGVLTAGNIGAGTIDATKIAANTITSGQIATNGVTASNIDSRNLTIKDAFGNIIFGSGATVNASSYLVPSSGWLNSNITINSNGTLSGAGGGAVSLGGLGAGAFATLNQITSANVTTYIAGAAIGTAQVGVLTAGNIGAGTIDATKIAANTITAGQIASATITSAQIAANTITASNIAANTITASQIAANTITAGQIAANTITASQIAANTITASQIAAGTITATQIATNTITTNEINNVATGQIIAGSFNFQAFTSTGSTTWTVPPYVYKLKITIVGGGGGGGKYASTNTTSGGGGGGGGALIKILTVTPGNTLTITVGSGGAGATTTGGNGVSGSASSVVYGATTLTANGGSGGANGGGFGGTGGSGGTASGGDINITGGNGGTGSIDIAGGSFPQPGGSAAFVGGSTAGAQSASPNSGSGGGSSDANRSVSAGNGGSGVVIIEY